MSVEHAGGLTDGSRPGPGLLVVMAKAPHPGLVKTRMCPPLSPEQAAELYACMLDDVLEATQQQSAALSLLPVVAVNPPDAAAEVAARAPANFRVIAQRGAGLGARMDHAVRQGCATGARRVLLRGSDNPALSLAHLRESLDLLDRHDVALTPDGDGGYGLVALKRAWPGLFEHPMSTGTVLDETVSSARQRGIDVALGSPCFDLDTAADLHRLATWRDSVDDLTLCVRTLRWVDEMGLLEAR